MRSATSSGDRAIVQRCQVHKMRNVREHLPEARRAMIRRWVALGVAEAQRGFRWAKGHAQMHTLVVALRPKTATLAAEKKVA